METTSGSGAGQEPPVAAQPPPSPLSGAYLLIVVGEPHNDAHKQDILRKIANGFLSWDADSCHVALDKELQAIIAAAPEGEEARNGERLIQFASENLVTEVLIQPQLNTLIQCIRNLLSSFTKHRHIIHAGYTFAGNGSWIVQDGTFSLADLIDALQEPEVQRVIRAYEHSVTIDVHCAPAGDWSTARLRREPCTRLCRVRVNPDDGASPATNIQEFVDYLAPFVRPQSVDQLLHPSDVVGNIRFSHPTLYVFPGGQGDAALFGINGFNMLVDGGFARKACFWDFVRHLDRLDAVLMTRINNSNCHGLSSILRRKRMSHVYPQIGHFFCNLQERKQPTTPDEEKVRDPLLVSLLDEGQDMVHNLKHLQLKPHICVRDSVLDPINLYHKVGHGKLDMYVISPAKDSKELKEFLSKWHSNDIFLFNSASKKPGDKDISFPFQNLVSICALLVWQPANPEDTITRILFPGSTPQHKIFEGLEKLRSLEFMKQPVCTAKTLSPSSSTIGINKVSKTKSTPAVIDKLVPGEGLSKPIPKGVTQTEPVSKQSVAKTATIPVSGLGETKTKPVQPSPPKPTKPKQEKLKQEKDNKTEVDKNIESDSGDNIKQDKPPLITDQLKEKESLKIKNEKSKTENKPKKTEGKVASRITEKKPHKVPSVEKKDSVKSSPTTPKKSIESKINGVATKSEIVKTAPKTKLKTSPASTPAKSTKEENNRKVVESKAKAAIASKTSAPKLPKKDENVVKQKPEKKSAKKPLSSSPLKLPSKTFSPLKGATKTVSKGKKDNKKIKGEIEKSIVTDSSAVSTPSTVDAETAIAKEGKDEQKDKVEKEGIKDIINKSEEKEKAEDDISKDIDESGEAKEKVEEVSVSEDVISIEKQDDRQVEASEKEYSEKEEEDEILIIEKVEIEQFGDDSVQDQESLESHIPDDGEDEIQKHLRDEAESEKKKDDQLPIEETQVNEEKKTIIKDDVTDNIPVSQDVKGEMKPSDLSLTLVKDITTEKVLTPENREQIEEEVQEIITSATDFVAKTKLEQSKESSELSADGIGSDEQKTSGETKDLLSSPEKLQVLSDKNLTDDDNKQDDTKDRSKEIGDVRYAAEESQPDEKISTTVESGATTAPTLPEDERIPLDEIKEGIEEKYDKEDTKEKEIQGAVHGRIEQPTTLPQVSIVPGGPYEVQTTQILRDIVKTPDEVADLPVHEEVDGVYEDDDFNRFPPKSKEEVHSISSKRDADVKEDQKEIITKEGIVLSKEELAKRVELQEDIRIGEEELSELKLIRQNLEAEDSKQEQKEIDLKSDTKISDRDSKHEMVLETEPVHSMLKAPEVAELVMVTPDSAPDSPMHLTNEKKDKTDAVPVADDKQTSKALEKITNVCKDEPLQEIKSEEIEDSMDIVVGLKKPIQTPKTPPASPVFGDVIKEKDQIDIIPEIAELAVSRDVAEGEIPSKSDLQSIPESITPIQNEDIDNGPTEKDQLHFEKQEVKGEDKITLDETVIGVTLTSSEKVPQETGLKIDDKEGSEVKDKEQSMSERLESSERIDTLTSIKEDFPKAEEKDTKAGKQEPSASPVDMGESTKLDKDQIVKEKIETPENASPSLSRKETISTLDDETEHTDKIKPSAVTSLEEENPAEPIDELVEKPLLTTSADLFPKKEETDTKKSCVSLDKLDLSENASQDFDKDEDEKHKVQTEKDGLGSSESAKLQQEIEEKPDETAEINTIEKIGQKKTPPSVSPIPSYIADTELIEDEGQKPETPISISPIPSDKGEISILEKGDIVLQKHDTPNSTSPVPSEKPGPTETLTNQIHLEQDAPKGFSPVHSNKGETATSDEEKINLVKKDIPKSITPDFSDTIGTMGGKNGHDTPKSISPAPSDKGDAVVHEKDQSVSGEKGTPKSVSPVPSEKGDTIIEEKEQSIIREQETPISVSSVPPEKEVSVAHEKEQKPLEKPDSPKSISPVPSDSTVTTSHKIEDSILEKQDIPLANTEIPDKGDTATHDKEQDNISKAGTPKSISPAPSDTDTIAKEKEPINLAKQDTKSISPVSSEKGEIALHEKKESIDVKKDSPKSTTPIPTDTNKQDKEEIVSEKPDDEKIKLNEKEQHILDERDSLKAVSPTPILKEDIIAHKKEDAGLEMQDTPKSISPVPSDKVDMPATTKIETISDKDTPKSISPVPSDKGDTTSQEKDQTLFSKEATPTSISPVPTDKEDSNIQENDKGLSKIENSTTKITPDLIDKAEISFQEKGHRHSLKEDAIEKITPEESVKGDTKAHVEDQSFFSKMDTPKSISPVPSDKADTTIQEKEQTSAGKQDTPKSISPVPSDKTDATTHEKENVTIGTQDTPKSISPVLSGKSDTTFQEKEQVTIVKQDTPKSISPVHSNKEDTMAQEKERDSTGKQDTPKSISPVPSDKADTTADTEKEQASAGNQDTPKSISSLPSDKTDIIAQEKEQSGLDEPDNRKSISPVPSDETDSTAQEKEQVTVIKQDTTKSISPVPSDKADSTVQEKEQATASKHDTPKSISPVPSDKADSKAQEKEQFTVIKQDTPKSISPVPSDKADSTVQEKEQATASKHDTPKSISPVPSDKADSKAQEKEEVTVIKQDTPKSISPVPSDKADSTVQEKEKATASKHDTPKSISPVPSDKSDSKVQEKEQFTVIKQDTPKSISPVPSDKADSTVQEKDQATASKHDTPKSISPVPSDKSDSKGQDKEEVTVIKQDTPKSISPVPSDKAYSTVQEKEQATASKHDTPKSISPVPSDKSDSKAQEKEDVTVIKQDTPKSISPVPSDKADSTVQEKEQATASKHDTPKSISPVPSDKSDSKAQEKEEVTVIKQDTPKSISPVPSDKAYSTVQEKEQATASKHDTPKSISPVPSDKSDSKAQEKEEVTVIKQDTPKSISPVPSDKADSTVQDKEKTTASKHDTPKSISPVPSDTVDATAQDKEEASAVKYDSPKSISPVPSDKLETTAQDKDQASSGIKYSPKSISPVPSDKVDTIAQDKEQASAVKQDSPKIISPLPSDKTDTTTQDKEQATTVKQDSPKSISPVPSYKVDTTAQDKEQASVGKQDSPKSISPSPSDKVDTTGQDIEQASVGKQDSSKSISPSPSDKEETAIHKSLSPLPPDDKIAGETDGKTISEEQDSFKQISSELNEKVESIETKQTIDTSKSGDLQSAFEEDGKTKDEIDSIAQTHDSPQSISPLPLVVGGAKDIKIETIHSEKYDLPEKNYFVSSANGVSETVLEKKQQNGAKSEQDKDDVPEKCDSPKSPSSSIRTEKEQSILERHNTSVSVSSLPTDREYAQYEEKLPTGVEKMDTPKSVSPAHSDKVDKEQSYSEKHDSPKILSPESSVKGDSKQADKEPEGMEKHDSPKSITPDKGTLEPLENEFTSIEKHDSSQSTSPVPSNKLERRPSEKESDYTQIPDASTKIISIQSDVVDSKVKYETETEKADTELSEKDKSKVKLDIQSTDVTSTKALGEKDTCKASETSEISGQQDIGALSLTTGQEYSSKIGAAESVVKSSSDQVIADYHSSSSSSTVQIEQSPAVDTNLGSSGFRSTQLSTESYQTPLSVNGKHDTDLSEVSCTGEDTVIEKTFQSKSIKTEKDIKADSESTVPSTLISSGLDSTLKESSTDINIEDSSTHSSVDHRSTGITEHSLETKSGLHSVDISSVSSSKSDKPDSLSSANKEISSSVHRMLVTGSSEDGGTETELCLSSVSKLPGGSYNATLGNVAHITQEESTSQKQEASFSTETSDVTEILTSTVPDNLQEKTIITTTVYTTEGQKETPISDSTKSSDIVKTITTTITKTFGDQQTTDVKTTEEIVSSSGEKSNIVDIEKTGKKSEIVSSGGVSNVFKKEISDAGRSGTPVSDLASERELETGGISTPHSDISSGQVSRAATHVWGESSEGRPDSRHGDSDDDIPCSPMSATSHMAQTPPQFDFDIHQHAKEGFLDETKSKDLTMSAAMTSSFYGSLPDDPLDKYIKEKQLPAESQMYSSMYVSKYGDDDEDENKSVISKSESQTSVVHSKTQDIDFETAIKEHRSVRGEDLTIKYTNGKPEVSVNGKSSHTAHSSNGLSNGKSSQPESLEYQESQSSSTVSSNILPKSVSSQPPTSDISSSSSVKPVEEKKDPIEGWGKPLGLPPPPRNLMDSPLSKSTLTLVWNPADEWGLPLGLPSPAPPPVKKDSMNGDIDTEITSTSNKTTPKKVARRNAENNKSASNTMIGKEASNKSKHPESPVKRASNKDAKSKSVTPVYMDLTYVPHHGNSNYTNVEFFKRIRARYYVFSGTEPSKEVFNALLEAKQTWEDKDLEVTIIPTYDTDTLGYWVAENEDLLAKYKIDLSPSASRCTINLQDHETSCSAYRLEF